MITQRPLSLISEKTFTPTELYLQIPKLACYINVGLTLRYLCRRGRENLREMTKDSFGTDSQGREYLYQSKDELDKNHRVDSDPSARNTEARMYEVPGMNHLYADIVSNMYYYMYL